MDFLGNAQGEAPPFVRLVAPTDKQQVAYKIGEAIADEHSWDWVNPTVWRLVGFESGKVLAFLDDYMLIARQWKMSLEENPDTFMAYFVGNKGYPPDDVKVYFDKLLSLRRAGLVPDTVYRPWTYEQKSVAEEAAETVSTAVRKATIPFIVLALGGIAAYAFFSTGLPRFAAGRRT